MVGFFASTVIGRSYALLAGLGVVAYVLGLRHAFDADHIAAIDNTVRKLSHEKKRPFTVGAWFSLGHSTIVVLMIVALVFVTRAVVSTIPAFEGVGAILGTTISGVFLWIIGIINAIIVIEIYHIFVKMRAGELDETQLDELLNKRGFMTRYLGRLFKLITESWQIFPIGVLFGLGFDTATEVALIAISVGVGASVSVPIWMILVLPLMFTCGMVLVDTTDGATMTLMYGWAFIKPVRKIYYNLTITIISVAVAFLIGTVELIQVFGSEFGLSGGFWTWIQSLDFETLGVAIVALFVFAWVIASLIYKYKKLDQYSVTAR